MRSHGAPSSLGNIVITRDQRNGATADAKGIMADPVNQTTVAISADTSSGYRNLFGDASAAELYKGFCDKERYQNYDNDEDRRRKNRRMLRWLALRFAEKPVYSDVLIADARNDDNLILAQLTVIFHLLHNTVYGRLREMDWHASDTRIFSVARKIVTRIYREIVLEDLLEKLLLPPVYNKYKSEGENAITDKGDARMPLEVSHAAARLGHFMVLSQYKINDDLGGQA